MSIDLDHAIVSADMKVNTDHGGRILYWGEPDGHVWEILTVSYARRAKA